MHFADGLRPESPALWSVVFPLGMYSVASLSFGQAAGLVYNTLVSCDDDGPFRPNGHRLLVTLRLAGDDVSEYLPIGGHFGLWLGRDVGEGVVTRRLFV